MSEKFYMPGVPLSVVTLTYVAPLAEFDAAMPDHVAWIGAGFEQGVVLVSGPNVGRTRGVMLVRGDEEAARAFASTGPFVARGLATVDVISFVSGMAVPALAALLG